MNPDVQVNVTQNPADVDTSANWQVVPTFNDSQSNTPSGPFDLATARMAAVALLGRTNCLCVQIQEVE